jgi:putative PIN family toxin of toxin-antitoxin system
VRVFLDTNVLVSAFASRGICADILEVILLDHDLIVGRTVLRELAKALGGKLKLPVAQSGEILGFVSGEAAQVIERAEPIDAEVDADDALVLGEARLGQAEYFVTGDAALLRLGSVEALRIVSPRQFWAELQKRE